MTLYKEMEKENITESREFKEFKFIYNMPQVIIEYISYFNTNRLGTRARCQFLRYFNLPY